MKDLKKTPFSSTDCLCYELAIGGQGQKQKIKKNKENLIFFKIPIDKPKNI